jgi:glycosyltransferase involved in cell wall biosynthesis
VGAVAAAGLGEVTGVELHPRSRTYGWEPGVGRSGAFLKISLPRVEWSGRAERRALRPSLERVLGKCGPDVVFVNGWGDFMSLETMAWARRAGVRLVVMSETRRVDGARSWWGEWVKSRIVGLCDAGLCGGESHRRYLGELGLAREQVVLGYNAVDNEFFAGAKKPGQQDDGRRDYREGREAPGDRPSEVADAPSGLWQSPRGKALHGPRRSEIGDRGDAAAALDGEPLRSGSGTERSPSLQGDALDAGRWSLDASSPATSNSLPATAPEALPRPYFLASNRFIERKNLERLIRAYARYCAGRAAQEIDKERGAGSRELGAGSAAQEIEDGRSKIEERKSEEKAETLKAESGKSLATSDSPLATSPIGEQCRWVWPLVLLGDGELRGELEGLCASLGLRTIGGTTNHTKLHERGEAGPCLDKPSGAVFSNPSTSELARDSENTSLIRSADDPASSPATSHSQHATAPEALSLDSAAHGAVIFAGFRQVGELRDFYAGAGAFIHPALAEPWGLVINEAMASGLPVISSRNVGAAEELVREGVNGFLFDPEDVEELAGLMGRVAEMPREERLAMGEASRGLIAEWGPERFARGAEEAARLAMAGPAKRAGVFDRVLLEVLIRR